MTQAHDGQNGKGDQDRISREPGTMYIVIYDNDILFIDFRI